jgi:signal transduction histidine kinase/ActR/RegA family two-component response regulator
VNGIALAPSPLRVVVIDDTEDLRDLIRIALTRGGMEVVGEAGNGLDGIRTVRAERPDVVLLDLSMPLMDGLQALPQIRRIIPAAKIIVLSGFGATQMAERALASGADGYLQKGMSLSGILERVREIALGPDVTGPSLGVVPSDHGPAAWEALALAPYGVLEVRADPPLRLVHANPFAARLLGHEPVEGQPLATMSAEIAALVDAKRTSGRTAFAATTAGRSIRVTVRATGDSLLVYLEESSQGIDALRRSVATTAHEIRGPVTVLSALAETLAHPEVVSDPQERDRLMTSVARQARMLDGITGDLLVTAQVERGTLRLDRSPVDPVDVARSVLADQQVPTAVEVVDERFVDADPLRLQQMLGNLVCNAVKYGEPPIVVRVRPDAADPDLLAIDVEDHGTGVPEEFRARLFQEFTRAPGTRATGVGLGLHVVRTLAEQHGGSVTYAPGPAGGAVFTLAMPAVSPARRAP